MRTSTVVTKIFLSLAIIISLLGFLLMTRPGLLVLTKTIGYFLPGTLTVAHIKGRVLGLMTFERLIYSTPEQRISVNKIDLRLKLSAILQGTVRLAQVNIDNATLVILKTPPKASSSFIYPINKTWPQAISTTSILTQIKTHLAAIAKLPFALDLKALTINILTINTPALNYTGYDIYLEASLSHEQWQIKQLKMTASKHLFMVKATFSPIFPYALSAFLDITHSKTLPGISGHWQLGGNLLRLNWQGHLTTPARLTMTGTLLNGMEIRSSWQWSDLHWPIDATHQLASPHGQVTMEGLWPTIHLKLNSTLSSPIATKVTLALNNNANTTQLNATLQGKDEHLNLGVRYQHYLQPAVVGQLDAQLFTSMSPYPLKKLVINSQFAGSSWQDLKAVSHISAHYFEQMLNAQIDYHASQLNAQVTLGDNQLTVQGKLPFPWHLTANLPHLTSLHPALASLKTGISADLNLLNIQKGQLTMHLNKGQFVPTNETPIPFAGGNLQAMLNTRELALQGNLTIDATKNLQLSLKLPQFKAQLAPLNAQKINGNISLQVNSLAFLQHLNNDIGRLQGTLHAILAVSGSIGAPILEGRLDLAHGQLSWPKLGIDLNPVQMTLTSHAKTWQATGTIASNQQAIMVTGKGDFSPTINGLLTLHGDNVPLLTLPKYAIDVSPKLTLEFTPDVVKIRGTIAIPKARIKPQSFTNSVTLTNDAVFSEVAQTPNPYNLDTEVRIEMGKDVMIGIQGLQGFLTGAVQLRQLPQKPLTATGELNVRDGKYVAYGQNLIIEQGQLAFNGGVIDNPRIRIRALRKFNNAARSFSGSNRLFDFNPENIQTPSLSNKTKVGIEVSGQLNSPKVRLFSIPANLSQADILSLLLLGTPANQASKSGGQLLLTAVSALNLNSSAGSLQLLSQLKQNLGIDFNLETNSDYNQKTNQTSDKTEFVVGKALSKRLYLSYNMGLSQTDTNTLTLKYLLNKFFSIQINTSVMGSGIDLLYTHHHNKGLR